MTSSESTTGAELTSRPLVCTRSTRHWTITLARSDKGNTLAPAVVADLERMLDECDRDDRCKLVVLEGQAGVFCTGLDFESVSARFDAGDLSRDVIGGYMRLLLRLSGLRKLVVANVDGVVLAGGLGLVAASDVVIASSRSRFCLSEALWGLLPACVAPFLIRRVGVQVAYRMTLTTEQVDAVVAKELGLVDVLTENAEDELRRLLLRVSRVQAGTINDAKRYFARFWSTDARSVEAAIDETTRLLNTERVRNNISNYVRTRAFPWET